jgi:hypothetical protein
MYRTYVTFSGLLVQSLIGFILLLMQGANAQLARDMLDKAQEPNLVMARVDQFNFRNRNAEWIQLNEEHLPGFPRLTPDYFRDITSGTHQE